MERIRKRHIGNRGWDFAKAYVLFPARKEKYKWMLGKTIVWCGVVKKRNRGWVPPWNGV